MPPLKLDSTDASGKRCIGREEWSMKKKEGGGGGREGKRGDRFQPHPWTVFATPADEKRSPLPHHRIYIEIELLIFAGNRPIATTPPCVDFTVLTITDSTLSLSLSVFLIFFPPFPPFLFRFLFTRSRGNGFGRDLSIFCPERDTRTRVINLDLEISSWVRATTRCPACLGTIGQCPVLF